MRGKEPRKPMTKTHDESPSNSTSTSRTLFDPVTLAMLAGVVLIMAISLMNMRNLNRVAHALDERLKRLEAQLPSEPEGPDPTAVHMIRTEGSPSKGPETAPVMIAEFSEFQCPFCLKADPIVKRIAEVYKDQVRIVWKHYPLSMHRNAMDAALAAEAAGNQNKFWEYHDKLFANQKSLEVESLQRYAKELGLDMDRFEKDRLNPETRKKVEADVAEAEALRVSATPSFFINGRFLRGAQPFESLSKLIDEELTKRNLPIPPKSSSN
jgi:protein-disulfide isomerase